MPESFGARLRQRREEQNIALSTIAEQTKIKLSLLEGLERDDVSHWPSGIFRRAYIRTYAEAIGLAPDAVLSEFLEAHPEPAKLDAAAAIAAAADRAHVEGGPPTRLRNIVESAMESISRIRRSSGAEGPLRTVVPPPTKVAGDPPAWDAAAPPSFDLLDLETVANSNDTDSVDAQAIGTAGAAVCETPLTELDESLTANSGDEPEVPRKIPVPEPPRETEGGDPFTPDFAVVGDVCTALGRVGDGHDLQPLLREAAAALNAVGVIVWLWDPRARQLAPALAWGYSDRVLAQLPGVKTDDDNATAAAFRMAKPCVTSGGTHTNGGLVVPLLAADGPAGVLAFELQGRAEHSSGVCAAARILAATLVQLLGGQSTGIDWQADVIQALDREPARPIRVNARVEGPVRINAGSGR